MFDENDRARRRGMKLGPQRPDGMSYLSGWIDPEARGYLEAANAAVRPGRHQPDNPILTRTPTHGRHDDAESAAAARARRAQ